MNEIQITQVRFKQQIRCHCGAAFINGDVIERASGVLLVCSSCHSDALEIEISAPSSEGDLWD